MSNDLSEFFKDTDPRSYPYKTPVNAVTAVMVGGQWHGIISGTLQWGWDTVKYRDPQGRAVQLVTDHVDGVRGPMAAPVSLPSDPS